MKVASFLFFFCLYFSPAIAETLTRLEGIAARYATMDDMLNDPEGLKEYREALKAYMGEGDSFDPVLDKFFVQIKDLSKNIPGFAEKAWKTNPDWKKQSYVIKGEFTGSGLQIKRESLLKAIEDIKTEAKIETSPLPIDKLVAQIKEKYPLKTPEELKKLSRKEQDSYRANLRKLSESAEIKSLSNHVVHNLLTQNEKIKDSLFSGDADIIIQELKNIEKPVRLKEAIRYLNLGISDEMMGYLKFSSPTHKKIIEYYDKGIKSIKEFQHMGDIRIDATLLAEIHRLHAEGVPTDRVYHHLDKNFQQMYKQWEKASEANMEKKKSFAYLYNSNNPFFLYELHEDSDRGTIRLKSQSGIELHFIPTPRPFHAFFAGRKTGECVGGGEEKIFCLPL
jgi:hypothetical protein